MPTYSTSAMDVARHLLAIEAEEPDQSDALAAAMERIHVKLREKLAVLIGQEGFAALFSRALHVSRRDMPGLGKIVVSAQSSSELQGTREFVEANADDLNAVIEGFSAIVGRFIGLLTTFIGDELSMQLLIDVWPELAQSDAARLSGDGDTPNE